MTDRYVTLSAIFLATLMQAYADDNKTLPHIPTALMEKENPNEAKPFPICFLWGTARPRDAKVKEKGFESVSNTIRLKFDADSKDECKSQFESYCRGGIMARGFKTDKLNGYFQETSDSSRINFTVDPACAVRKTADNR
ncbi:MAG: hypothetical protein AABZ06_06425 [Bdellovibrionota bacterium]